MHAILICQIYISKMGGVLVRKYLRNETRLYISVFLILKHTGCMQWRCFINRQTFGFSHRLLRPCRSTLQAPGGVLGAVRTPLHAVLGILRPEAGGGNPAAALTSRPKLCEAAYRYVYFFSTSSEDVSRVFINIIFRQTTSELVFQSWPFLGQ